MAAQRRPGAVVDERPVAVGAGLDVAAVAAHDDRRRPAPVDHEDRAVAVRGVELARARPRARRTAARDCRRPAPRACPRRARCGSVPAGRDREDGAPVPSGSGVAHALDRRRRASEDDRRAGQPGQLERRVARLEAWRAIALVGGVVLLVDDHEADVLERRQQRRPRPDDDVRVAGPDPAPLVGALALAEPRVEDRDADREVGAQAVDDRASRGRSPARAAAPGRPAAREAAIAST